MSVSVELEPAVHIYMMQQRESCQQKTEQKIIL